jgi:hypothetical protein
VALAVAGDVDVGGLGLFGDRNGQPQHPSVVLGPHPVHIQVVSQEQLPAEHAARASGSDHLGVAALAGGSFGLDREHVALDVKVDVLGIDTGQVELQTNSSAWRQASIGMIAGRVVMPNTCSVRRSSSRKGSVRINMVITSYLLNSWVVLFGSVNRQQPDTVPIDFLYHR